MAELGHGSTAQEGSREDVQSESITAVEKLLSAESSDLQSAAAGHAGCACGPSTHQAGGVSKGCCQDHDDGPSKAVARVCGGRGDAGASEGSGVSKATASVDQETNCDKTRQCCVSPARLLEPVG